MWRLEYVLDGLRWDGNDTRGVWFGAFVTVYDVDLVLSMADVLD